MPKARVNGAEIYYEEAGSGTPLILSAGGLQGALGSYQTVIAGLARAHRVIAYDRRFGGQSASPMVVQTWDMACRDAIGLMDTLGIDQAHFGGGSFGAAISLRCAALHPERVRAVVASNIAGGLICNANLASRLFRALDIALTHGMAPVVAAFDKGDRFAPFSPERAQHDAGSRKELEAMDPRDFAQVMRDTIHALFDGPYVSLGMTREMLEGIRKPVLIMPGNNDVHPRAVAEQVHRLVPNAVWADLPPHDEAPDRYVERVLAFLATAARQP